MATEEIKEGQEYDIHIGTKYYDADVQVVFYHHHPDDIDDIIKSVGEINVVLYFFEKNNNLDEYLKSVLAMAKKVNAEISLLVRMGIEEFIMELGLIFGV